MTDESILLRMEEQGREVRRVSLDGAVRSESAAERYDVVGEIARGGVGVVLRGRDNDLGRDVALKLLHDEHVQSPELVQRFVEEAQIGGQLQHPGIVPVYELGLQSDERPFFAMKLVKGDTLAARLADRIDPSEGRRELLAVFRDVCRTMAYAHARGVIHRDLKPSNVMIGGFGEVQVVDWGFAKVLRKGGVADEKLAKRTERTRTIISKVRTGEGSDASVAGSVMGTPAYMPPEQALGRVDDLDAKSDLFSLGAILAEILTGRPPYEGSSTDRMTAAAQARLEGAYTRLDACGADERLVALCRRCLQPLPKDRPPNASAIADEVAAYLSDAEGRAHRARVRALEAEAEAAGQRRKRRHTLVVASSALAALAIAATAYFWLDADRKNRDRERRSAVEVALREVSRREAAGDWSGALAAAERAVDLGHEPALADALRAKGQKATALQARREDDEAFLTELDEIRAALGRSSVELADPRPLRPGQTSGTVVSLLQPEDEQRSIDAAYADAFASRFGSVAESRERLEGSHLASAFAENLGFWVWLRRTSPALQDQDWRRLYELAQKIDAGNEDVRDALVERDAQQLLVIVRERGDALPPGLAAQVGLALTGLDRAQGAVAFLRGVHRRHPGDFWVNMRLGHAASVLEDHRLAATHYRAAVAIRPAHATAWNHLALALRRMEDPHGAADAYRKAIELAPDVAILRNRLGALLCDDLGEYDQGIEAFRAAIELDPQLVYPYDNIGVSLRWKRELDAAVLQHRKALAMDPEYAHAWHNLGTTLAEKKEFAEAVDAHERAVALAPEVAAIRIMHGRTLTLMGRYDEAVAAIETGIELAPESALGHGNLAATLANQGEHEAAIHAARRALARDPDLGYVHAGIGWVFMKQGRLDAAEAAFQRAVELDPDYVPVRMWYGTLLCDHLRRFDEAIAQFDAVPADRPERVDAQNNIGVALRGKNDLHAAVEAHRKALAIDREHVDAWESLGVTLAWMGEFDEAIAALERTVELDPTKASALANLAEALRGRGLLEAALARAGEAVALDPGLALAHSVRGNILRKLGRPKQAVAAYRAAVEAAPEYTRGYRNLGDALRRTRDPHGAIEAYRKAVALDPTDREVALKLAATLANTGALEESIAPYRRALALDPESALVHDGLGISLRDTGRLDEALAMHRRAVRLAPTDPLVHLSLALTHHWRNELEEALDAYERALELSPKLERARVGRAGAKQLLALRERLPAVLAGEDEPETWQETLMLANLARSGGDAAGALRLYRRAFDAHAEPVTDGRGFRSYASAARAAVQVGETDQALAWLRTDLEALARQLDRKPAVVERTLRRWKRIPDFVLVRDGDDPSADWRRFWADVDALLAEANAAAN